LITSSTSYTTRALIAFYHPLWM